MTVFGATVYVLRFCDAVIERGGVKNKKMGQPKKAQELQRARQLWVKWVQVEMREDLQKSIKPVSSSDKVTSKIRGPYRRLSPFEDESGIWRVGLRMEEFTPFTRDKKPPVILPTKLRLTYLLMLQAHQRGHVGVNTTVVKFRQAGYWTPRAGMIARRIRKDCVTCRRLDSVTIKQRMGAVPRDRLVSPVAWGQVELDLMGPFTCRRDVNKRTTMKVWGAVMEDKNSGAVYCDVVMDYSAPAVVTMLGRSGNKLTTSTWQTTLRTGRSTGWSSMSRLTSGPSGLRR
jgi:hypothetical protein